MQQLAALLRRMELRGISKAHCLAGSGISEEFLEQPHLRPTRPQYEAVLGNIIARSPPGVGLAAGLMASVQDYGVLGHACLASGTMREVNHLHRKYSELQDEFTFFTDRITAREWQIAFGTHLPMGPLARFQIETLMATTKRSLEMYSNAQVRMRSIHLAYEPPEYHELYRQMLGCPVHFNENTNLVRVDASVLDAPTMFPCAEVRRICEAHCERLLATLRTPCHLTGVLRRQLLAEPGRRPTLERVSTLMGISSSTLRNKLREEGKSFHSIMNGVRRELAIDYVVSTTLLPKQIAFNLGYSNVHNFRRAFHEWTGTTPTLYRQRERAPSNLM